MQIMIELIAKGLLPILTVVISYFLIPFLKEKTTKEQRETALILVQAAVMAAEQIFSDRGKGLEKKEYVFKFLNDRGLKITEAELDVLIEAAVKEMKMQI